VYESLSSELGDVPGRTTNLGEGEHDAPHLALVAEAVFADSLQLGVTVDLLGTVDLSGASSRPVAMVWVY